MSPSKWLRILFVVLALVLIAVLFYKIPWVETRLSWRLDIAQTYLRGVFQPAGAVPTPKPLTDSTSKLTTPPALTSTSAPVKPSLQPTNDDDIQVATTPLPITPTTSLSPTTQNTPTPIPDNAKLEAPPWEKQDWNNCGPAALSMYLNYYGWEGDQFSISSVLKPTREDRNVNVEELVHYARNYAGWLQTQYRVGGDIAMLKQFIAAGIPVMIEASFYFVGAYWPNDDLWAAHYLLVTAYDESRDIFTVQDTFYGPNQVMSYKKLDEYWQPFNRVFVLSYLPHQEETVKAILGNSWDEVANREIALESAREEVENNPKDAFAWFNLGSNLLYFERYEDAAAAYDEARSIGWPQRMLRYQFGPFFAYFHAGRNEDVYVLADYALERTPNSEEALLWRGWARYRDGDVNGAVADFQAALEANYLYLDAQYALDYVTGQ
jgi:tetratricopeptide (TPR) repeat protein